MGGQEKEVKSNKKSFLPFWAVFWQFLRNQGSVRLYRNGFRVLPYGEPGDDWLKLEIRILKQSKENFITLGQRETGKKRHINSGHYVLSATPRAVHTTCLDQCFSENQFKW